MNVCVACECLDALCIPPRASGVLWTLVLLFSFYFYGISHHYLDNGPGNVVLAVHITVQAHYWLCSLIPMTKWFCHVSGLKSVLNNLTAIEKFIGNVQECRTTTKLCIH